MTWPVFLPEKAPRLFMQVWDYGAARSPTLGAAAAPASPARPRVSRVLRVPRVPRVPRVRVRRAYPRAACGCADLIGADDAIGEAELNLKSLYDRALKTNSSQLIERQWVSCTHPSYAGVRAQVCLTIELLTRAEAELQPAGKAREAPNENPHLDEPLRPSILDALGINLNFFNPFLMFKKYFVRLCVCLILVGAVVVVFLLVS